MTPAARRVARLLGELVARRAGDPGRAWWAATEGALAAAFERVAWLEAFTGAARRLGKGPIELDAGEVTQLAGVGVAWPLGRCCVDELGRVVLLLAAAARLPDAELETLVEECYRQGDSRERQAALRGLPLLPDPARFVAMAVDACRSHIQPVFEAIACENPYPAEHFPEPNFNQMVLKALFLGIALDRVVGWRDRATPELRRMAADYASERRAAGRPVFDDVARLAETRGSEP